jgi:DNA-binding MarR family transcriptional regulator
LLSTSKEDVVALDLEAGERLARQLFRLVRLIERSKAQATHHDREGEQQLERATFGLLVQLVDHGPMRTSALAEAVYSDVSTVSRQVNQLVAAGLVERQADPGDGRATLLAATEPGKACLTRARERRNERVAALVADWPQADREQLVTLLDRFNTAFESTRMQRPGQESE